LGRTQERFEHSQRIANAETCSAADYQPPDAAKRRCFAPVASFFTPAATATMTGATTLEHLIRGWMIAI
jgi:hypothetical protein